MFKRGNKSSLIPTVVNQSHKNEMQGKFCDAKDKVFQIDGQIQLYSCTAEHEMLQNDISASDRQLYDEYESDKHKHKKYGGSRYIRFKTYTI